jgi:hypothetical protein
MISTRKKLRQSHLNEVNNQESGAADESSTQFAFEPAV